MSSTKAGKRFDLLGSEQFSQKQILGMLLPLILDQLFIYAIGLLTTAMISSSGEDSVAAVSLVNPIAHMSLSLFTAFAAGGGVIVAQYKGHGDEEKVKEAIGQTVFIVMSLGLVLSGILLLLAKPIIYLLYPTAEPSVQQKAVIFLGGMAINNFVHALRCACTASLRGVGEIKSNMYGSILINASFFVFNFVFINLMHLDIYGTLLSYFLARVLGMGHSIYHLFLWKHSKVRVPFSLATRPIRTYQQSIVKLGLPFSAEEVFFNAGAIIVSTFVVLLGTGSVAANAIVTSVLNTTYAPVMAVGILSTTVVGQCIGAGKKDLARWYGKRINALGYAICFISAGIMLLILPGVISIYNPSAEVLPVVHELIRIAMVGMLIIYPVSCVMPYVLKAAGDAYYSTGVSLVAMWAMRVGMGYVAAIPLKLGLKGIFYMMIAEWVVRAIGFVIRFKGNNWLKKKAINTED